MKNFSFHFNDELKPYSGQSCLILVPTPISDVVDLDVYFKAVLNYALKNDDIILVEDHKPARRRWLSWGLPREAIEKFICYNEHTRKDLLPDIMKELSSGKNVFILSDGGLPAFCDPGRELVKACHDKALKVTSLPFHNSVVLALALSGFDHDSFIFNGFLPRETQARGAKLQEIISSNQTHIVMDTPYKLIKVLDEINRIDSKKELFLALNLNDNNELVLRGNANYCKSRLIDKKAEFILILGPS